MNTFYNLHRFWKRTLKVTIGLLIISGVFIFGVYLVSFLLGPPSLTNDQNTVYFSIDEEKFGEETGFENRNWVQLEEMSPYVIDATLAIEDQRFFDHHGFDLRRIFTAALKDLQSRSLKEGASTITQQYARNLYLTHEKTWSRKLKEAFYTIRLEMFYSKREILEGYLNTIYYGHGAYGIEAASQFFYAKDAKDLNLAEAALLAGVPKGPTYFSPLNDKKKAVERQQLILRIMHDKQYISTREYQQATHESLTFVNKERETPPSIGNHFKDMVLQEAADILHLNKLDIQSGGYQIYTTLDQNIQVQLEETITDVIPASSDMEAGAIIMDPHSGAIHALVGGRNYKTSSYNRAIDAKRMSGSTFKPFLYYAALNHGFTATKRLISKPTSFKLANGELYQPSNYNGYYAYEPITLAHALALSDNIYAVKTHLFLGTETLVKTARQFGITSELPKVPSLALGTASVSVKEMVTGYGILANGGKEIDGYTIEKIVNRNGVTVFQRKEQMKKQVLDEKKAFILTDLLTGMFDETLNGYMSVTGSTISNQLSRAYAGKSGTTESDSWMIGYSPTIVTGIWMGYDDNRSIELVAEKSYAKLIWAKVMEKIHAELPVNDFIPPRGVIGIPIDPTSGMRATPYCPTRKVMYFEKGTEPNEFCTEHYHGQSEQKGEKGLFQKWFELFFE